MLALPYLGLGELTMRVLSRVVVGSNSNTIPDLGLGPQLHTQLIRYNYQVGFQFCFQFCVYICDNRLNFTFCEVFSLYNINKRGTIFTLHFLNQHFPKSEYIKSGVQTCYWHSPHIVWKVTCACGSPVRGCKRGCARLLEPQPVALNQTRP